MLHRSHLIRGLDALSRAHASDYFGDGHRGAAIIAAYFLCAEEPVEAGVTELIAETIDDHWTDTPLCAPFPVEDPSLRLIDRVTAAASASVGEARGVGHNVIFVSLALKAFRALPEAITPARVDGICRLVAAFEDTLGATIEEGDAFPDLDTPERLAEFALQEFVASADAFIGRGQGWTGHMLTVGRAVIDLLEAGHGDLAWRAQQALKQYAKRTRLGPLETDIPRPEHPASDLLPLERTYWLNRRGQDPGLGHCVKYPYGFLGLMRLATDAHLQRRCRQQAFRVL
jgi:hypothetical protein